MTYPYSEPPLKKPWTQRLNPLYVLIVPSIFILFISIFFSFRPAKVEAVAETTTTQTKELGAAQQDLDLDGAYAALFRHLKADKICYVQDRNSYFIHFDKEDTKDDIWNGWFILKSPTFYANIDNHTWFLTNTPDEDFIRVWPNVEDMSCAEKEDYDDK